MKDFIASYCHKNDDKVNDKMFNRSYDKPLVDFIVETCKNLEVIPAIKLESWELITDQTKIQSTINKKNAKDPKIKNNKCLERLAQPNNTLYDLLVLNFRVTAKGQDVRVTRKVRVLKQLRGGYYQRNGKKVIILNQVVDNSTFVKGNVLNFKTKLYPIKLDTISVKFKFHDGESASCPCFRLDLLTKVINPLYYFLAEYGIFDTIEMFNLNSVMSIVDTPLDTDHYVYIKANDHLYIEIQEQAFYAHEFVSTFAATLYDIIKTDKNATIKDVYDGDYWNTRLAEIFSKKVYPNKAERILISFNKIMDKGSRKQLLLRKYHRKNTFTIIRWMMTNYAELLKKDSNDLKYKRVRANETLAYFFDKRISANVYSLLNTDNPPFEKYIRLLNSINEDTLLRGVGGGAKSSPSSMFRYERYNDFDAIEISRFTLKGPTGLNGGKHKTSTKYRDIYASQYGRYDLNVCSSSDPGLTGYLCANVQLTDTGYFDGSDSEPDDYDPVIDAVLDKYAEEDYEKNRKEYITTQISRDENGFFTLKKRHTAKELDKMFNENPGKYGLYRTADGLHLIPRMETEDTKGFITLIRRHTPKEESEMVRDKDGFMVLQRVITKLDKQKAVKK